MAFSIPSKFRPLIQQLRAAFRKHRPEPAIAATHYVSWAEMDTHGVGAIYATQHMSRNQARTVAEIKEIQGAQNVRVMRAF
jgi:hypothetical protein